MYRHHQRLYPHEQKSRKCILFFSTQVVFCSDRIRCRHACLSFTSSFVTRKQNSQKKKEMHTHMEEYHASCYPRSTIYWSSKDGHWAYHKWNLILIRQPKGPPGTLLLGLGAGGARSVIPVRPADCIPPPCPKFRACITLIQSRVKSIEASENERDSCEETRGKRIDMRGVIINRKSSTFLAGDCGGEPLRPRVN